MSCITSEIFLQLFWSDIWILSSLILQRIKKNFLKAMKKVTDNPFRKDKRWTLKRLRHFQKCMLRVKKKAQTWFWSQCQKNYILCIRRCWWCWFYAFFKYHRGLLPWRSSNNEKVKLHIKELTLYNVDRPKILARFLRWVSVGIL